MIAVVLVAGAATVLDELTRDGDPTPSAQSATSGSTILTPAEIASSWQQVIVRIDVTDDGGTTTVPGILFLADGHVLSADTPFDGPGSADTTVIEVTTSDGVRRPAERVGLDPVSGIAVLDIEGTDHPTVGSVIETEVSDGDPVVILTASSSGITAVSSTVLAARRRVELDDGGSQHGVVETRIADDSDPAAVLLTPQGAPIALVTSDRRSDAAPGVVRAVPLDWLLRIATSIATTGSPGHPWLGALADDVDATDDSGGARADIGRGGRLLSVEKGGPAERAGLRAQDVVVSIDDKDVDSTSDLVMALRDCRPGQTVSIDYRRGEALSSTRVTLGERP